MWHIIHLLNNLLLGSFATKSEDDDCVCDQYVYEPEYTIQKTPVIEKKCEPCSFWDWKPKEPELFDASKQQLKRKEEAKKKRTLKDCYPEMVIDDGCPAKKKKKTPPKWSEVFPNNVCLCECKTKKQEEEELAAAKLEQQVSSLRNMYILMSISFSINT